MDCHRLRIIARPLGVARVDAGTDGIQIQFAPNPQVDAGKIVTLMQRSREYQLSGPDRLEGTGKNPRGKRTCEAYKESICRVERLKQCYSRN